MNDIPPGDKVTDAVRHPLARKIAKITLAFFALIVVIFIGALIYITTPHFNRHLGSWISHNSGRHISVGEKIAINLWSREPRFVLNNVKIGNADWSESPHMFEAKRIEFSLRPLQLLRGRLVVPELILDTPIVLLEKNSEGKANWNFTQNPQALALKQPLPEKRHEIPVIRYLKVTDGKLTYNDKQSGINTEVNVTTISGESGQEDSIRVNGKGAYQKQPFLLELTGASILQLRESSKPYPFTLKTTIGPTSAEVQGTVKDPIRMEAFDVLLKLKGKDASDLFPITGIALPPTPPYEVSGQLKHEREGKQWHFEDFSGRMGHSDLKGDLAWHPEQEPPYLGGKFTSDNLDIADLGGFIGAHKSPADDSRVIPDTPLDISRLMAMNADVTFRGKQVKQEQILQDLSFNAHLKDGVLHLDPLTFDIAKGKINADLVIEGKKNPPVTTAKVNFQRLSLNNLFDPLAERYGKENVSAGLLGGTANLKGTGKSLRDMLATSNGKISMAMEGGQLSRLLLDLIGLDLFRTAGLILTGSDKPVPLQCVIAQFAATNGILETETFLIDTDVTAIRAQGGVNLRDETIDLTVTTSQKKPSLFSAHSPIEVKGTLKHPRVGINKAALIARGGVAAAIAAIAPPAALIAFIEPGLGKGGNCAAFVNGKAAQ